MIVTDLDGTLLHDDKTISDYTMRVFRQCRARGIKVVYATARGNSAKELAPCELFDGFVRMNGAKAFIGDTPVYSKMFHVKQLRAFLRAAGDAGLNIVAVSDGARYANYDATALWPRAPQYERVDFDCLNVEVEKLYTIIEKPQTLALLKQCLPNGLYLFASAHDGFVMVTHEDATKPKAVAALATHWCIAPGEIVAFGDDLNDLDMLRFAGKGVAMANAVDKVKQIADERCGSNENDGVARWLEENLL